MKAVTIYVIIMCVSVILAAVAVDGVTSATVVDGKPSLKVALDARKASLTKLDVEDM